MLRDVNVTTTGMAVNVDALRSEIRRALINQRVNACPMAMRVAWHGAGTFDAKDAVRPGGSNGATIRFDPECSDPANAGLSIIRDLLHPIKYAFPHVSYADLYAFAGCVAIEFLGGPRIPFNFGRSDQVNGSMCPLNGRLPDASKGADHLRDVFQKRMGFTDRDIVALSGAHTLGRCHAVRSGYDGPWTSAPLRFDNEYYRNLLSKTWAPRGGDWKGPLQFEDQETHSLMMLPTDMALINDAKFRPLVELFAKDEKQWFTDFASAYARLLSLGCPATCDPNRPAAVPSSSDVISAEFREQCMHGSVIAAQRAAAQSGCNIHQLEATSGRSALHKAAFWGHTACVAYLLSLGLNLNVRDFDGHTALIDAAQFGHEQVAKLLVDAKADHTIVNKNGFDALGMAIEHSKPGVVALLRTAGARETPRALSPQGASAPSPHPMAMSPGATCPVTGARA
jgi:catalase (peroxidase I)